MNIEESVFVALGELGDKTSLAHLQKRVQELSGKLPVISYVCTLRLKWRRDIGSNTDARKHADIPRRNMLNDQLVTPKHVASIFSFFTKTQITPEQLLELINDKSVKFHSLDQLVNAIKDMQDLQLMFDRMRV